MIKNVYYITSDTCCDLLENRAGLIEIADLTVQEKKKSAVILTLESGVDILISTSEWAQVYILPSGSPKVQQIKLAELIRLANLVCDANSCMHSLTDVIDDLRRYLATNNSACT